MLLLCAGIGGRTAAECNAQGAVRGCRWGGVLSAAVSVPVSAQGAWGEFQPTSSVAAEERIGGLETHSTFAFEKYRGWA